jgi:dephospho-CoA kinase
MITMLRVGLTGGIGAGKSTVAARLAEHGAVLIDSDRLAREVVEPGTPGLAAVVKEFGDQVLADDGSLDRPALAAVAFADPDARNRLNGILHPLIGQRTAELIKAAPPEAIIVHDVPLLVENSMAPMYHLVVVVHADVQTRVERIMANRGMTEEDARARIAAQATDEERREVADVWLDNSGSADEVLAAVDALWADRLVPYEANVRLRRPADPPPAHKPNPTVRYQMRRLVERLRFVAGDRAERVEPVMSESPEDPQPAVIDMRLTVRTPEDVDALMDPLAEAGFPRANDHHASADPGRPVRVWLKSAA